MRIFTFILLWIGIIIVISLLNYHPNSDRRLIVKKTKVKKIDDEYTEEEYVEEHIEEYYVSKTPYISMILGLVFLPLATIFTSSLFIHKKLMAPYLLVVNGGLTSFVRTYDIVAYIIIVEIIILFAGLIFRNRYIHSFIRNIVKFAMSLSILLFLIGFVMHLI